MADPVTYPWVNFLMSPTKDIDSTPLQIFGSDKTCLLDSIWICNTVDTELYVALKIVTAGRVVVEDIPYMKDIVVIPATTIEVLKGSLLIMEPGDLLYASTSYSGDRCNTFVSYRKLNELEGS